MEAVPKLSYGVQLDYFGGNRTTDLERLPTRVFVAKKGWFRQPSVSDELLQTRRPPSQDAMVVPVSLTWGAEHDINDTLEVCRENAGYTARSVCRSNHSFCYKGARG